MKKSQTLAALALAFALGLGVVAPAANTYAKYAGSVTETQQTEINYAMALARADAADVANLSNYETVYTKIDTETTGVRAKLQTIINKQVADYKNAIAGLNEKVANAERLADLAFRATNLKDGVNFDDAQPVDLTALESTDDLQAAYDALSNLNDQVSTNRGILSSNYNDDAAGNIASLRQTYRDLNTSLGDAMTAIKNAFANAKFNVAASTSNSDAFVKAFKAIDETAWNNMVNSDAWKNADANTTNAIRWGMIIKAAEALPKYNLVAPVIAAEADMSKITSADVAVDYAKAKQYVAAFNQAVAAFAGTTPTDPTTPGATIRTLTSQNGEVTVTGAFEEGVELMVGPVTLNTFGDKAYEAYDISLYKDGKKYTFNSNAVVTIKLIKIDGNKSNVYYVNDANEASRLTSSYANNTVTFVTNHFSVYAVVEDSQQPADDNNNGTDAEDPTAPGTGIVSSAEGNAATTVSIVAGLATALTALGAGVVAYRNARRSSEK